MSIKEVGRVAPSFTLKNQNDENISLKNFKGEKIVILYFYPKAMTPGCTTQACGLRDFKRKLSSNGIVALGVSPDSPDRLKRFEEKQGLNFDLLSDPDHKIADKYGVWGPKKFMGREYEGILRTTFIIGRDGKIKHILSKVKTKTHHEDVLTWIKENLS